MNIGNMIYTYILCFLVSTSNDYGVAILIALAKHTAERILQMNMMVGGCLQYSNDVIKEFLTPREVRRGVSRTTPLEFQRVDFGLFRRLFHGVPRDTTLNGTGVQKGCTVLKKEI